MAIPEAQMERHQWLFQFATDAYFLIDLQGNIIDGNQAAEEMVGCSRTELIGQDFFTSGLLSSQDASVARTFLARNAAGESTEQTELVLTRKNGEQISVEIRTHPIKVDGQSLVMGIARQIGDRKAVDATLRESETRYRELFDNTTEMIQCANPDGTFASVNRAWRETLGYSSDDVDGLNIFDIVHPDCLKQFQETLKRVISGEKLGMMEATLRAKDGRSVFVEGNVSCSADGKLPNSTRAFLRDVTARKSAEAELSRFNSELEERVEQRTAELAELNRQLKAEIQEHHRSKEDLDASRDQLKNAQQAAHIGTYFLAVPSLEPIRWSEECYRIVGIEPSSPLPSCSDYVNSIVHPPHREESLRVLQQCVRERAPFEHEYRIRRPDGELRWVRSKGMPVIEEGAVVSIHGTLHDVTDQKATELTMWESEERFRTIFQSEPECVKLLDVEGRLLDMNPAGLAMVEADSLEQVRGQCIYPIVVPDDQAIFVAANEATFQGKSAVLQFEIVGLRGTRRWMESHSTPLRNATGKITAALSVTRDVTNRKKTEQRLQLTQFAVDTAVDAIFWFNPEDGRFVYVNDAACRSLGYERDELLELTVRDIDLIVSHKSWPEFSQTIASEPLHRMESSHLRKDGDSFPVEVVVSNLQLDGTNVFCAHARDITARKQADEELRKSQELLRSILDNLPQYIVWKDRSGRYLGCNQSAAEFSGFESPKDVMGRTEFEMSFSDLDAKFYRRWDRRVMDSDQPIYHLQEQMHRNDGRTFWLNTTRLPLHSADGNVMGVLAVADDITERREAERALQASEVKWRSLTEHSLDYVLTLDRNLNIEFCNRASPGLSVEELIGTPLYAYVALDRQDEIKEILQRVLRTRESADYDTEFASSDGDAIHYESRVSPRVIDDQVIGLTVASRDVTRRRRAEEALHTIVEGSAHATGEMFYQLLVRHLAIAFDRRYVFIAEFAPGKTERVRTVAAWANGELVENFEYDLSDSPCANVVQSSYCFYPCNIQQEFPRDKLLVEMGAESYMGIPITSTSGQVVGLLAVLESRPVVEHPEMRPMLEIFAARIASEFERNQIENELRNSEQQFRSIFEQAGMSLALIEVDSGRFVETNTKFNGLLGYSAKELAGMKWTDITHFDRGQGIADETSGSLASEIQQCTLETSLAHKDSSRIWVNLTVSPFGETAKDPVHQIVIVEDITQRKQAMEENRKLQAQLHHTQKMDAIGQLASGVAHEFNNLLFVIRSNAELLLLDTKERLSENVKNSLKEIERGCERASTLTGQMLSFARKKDSNLAVLDINQVVRNSESMLRRLVGTDIKLRMRLSPFPVLVQADESDLDQVLLNLILNARDAMPDGGILTFQSDSVFVEELESTSCYTTGVYGRLAVIDDGCGMSQETVRRVFEPFYTTKPAGVGTGLGLSTVYSDIARSNGFVSIDSTEGEGTSVNVHLPQAQEAIASTQLTAEDVNTGGPETILVCDDEEIVLSSVSALLECVNYSVICVRSAREALEKAERHSREISLLVTDVTMPGMDGFELGKEFKKKYPDIKIMYSSGFTADRVAIKHLGDDEFFRKGSSTRVMLEKIRRILDSD